MEKIRYLFHFLEFAAIAYFAITHIFLFVAYNKLAISSFDSWETNKAGELFEECQNYFEKDSDGFCVSKFKNVPTGDLFLFKNFLEICNCNPPVEDWWHWTVDSVMLLFIIFVGPIASK